MASQWVVMTDVGTRPCEVCGRPRPDDGSPRLPRTEDCMGGCPRCTTISDLKRTIPLGVPLLVLGYFVAPWREYLPDAINEPLKKFIIAAIFLIGLIVLGYVFFRARRRLK